MYSKRALLAKSRASMVVLASMNSPRSTQNNLIVKKNFGTSKRAVLAKSRVSMVVLEREVF